ncbi:hypothetical protein D3C78_1886500 [compost metagenome]
MLLLLPLKLANLLLIQLVLLVEQVFQCCRGRGFTQFFIGIREGAQGLLELLVITLPACIIIEQIPSRHEQAQKEGIKNKR